MTVVRMLGAAAIGIATPDVRTQRLVLFIGSSDEMEREARWQLPGAQVVAADYDELTPDLIESLRPEIVLCSLLCDGFDCIDVGERLSALGYRGILRILMGAIPRPHMVTEELRSLLPDLVIQRADSVRLAS